ncbi:hypothetical protein FRC01_002195 [Tulasnella sp. 417]|nr:hypothetical protein FRC01_002195 [Tulasnella sp. 417]
MPRSSRTIPTSEVSESEQSLDPRIYEELVDHIVQVETDAFIRAVLYKDTETMEEDRLRVAEYLILSQTPLPHEGRAEGDPADSSPPHPTIPPPTTKAAAANMLPPRGRHVRSVRHFRAKIKAVDNAWLPAQPPQDDGAILTAGQSAGPPLDRVFRDTHKESRSFSRDSDGQAGLKPDLCLLIEPGDTPEESEDKPKESEGKPKESGGEPKVVPHWKDVLVPIEVKKDQSMNMSTLVQIAQYARSVMLEQFDRNFVITVLITGTTCRVFRWDVAGAQVTKAFDTRSMSFIQVMGRLATMTPSELGYDTHFSNAGRVRSTEIEDIRKHLTIHLSKPRPFFDHNATFSTRECSENGPLLVVDLEKIQFESKDPLFNRATRVWRAVAVNDPPPEEQCLWSIGTTYIIKQDWADDRQPNEGFLHTVAQEVDVVPQLLGMEERQFTSSFRARFQKGHVLGGLSAADVGDEDVGGNEDLADQQVASNVGVGLIELDKLGIIHRDISYGNLLLPLSRDGKGQASIIDFGLSHLKDEDILKQHLQDISPKGYILESSRPHDHVTGTLPFVAHELLFTFEEKEGCEHELHHDVESVFWVLLYICLKEHLESGDKFEMILQALTSHNTHTVQGEKWAVLMPPKITDAMRGLGIRKFRELQGFFEEFIQIWQQCRLADPAELPCRVRDLASRKLQAIQNKRKSPTTPDPDVSAPAKKKAKHPKAS